MVKRLRFINLIFLIILSGSCERESLTNAIDSPFKGKDIDRIVKAQEWLLKNAPITKSDEQWNPMWEDAFTDDFSSIQTVEIPLELKKFSIPIHPECKAKYNETKDPKYLNAITRLIIKTDSKTGRTDGFFMYIIPSLKYLEKTNFRPLNNSYLSKDEKYDGYIIFRDLSGNYVNGWMYEDGKIKKSLKPATNELPLTKAVNAITWCQPVYTWSFTIWFQNNGIVIIADFLITETTVCWTVYDCELPPEMGGAGGDINPPPIETFSVTINSIGDGTVIGAGSYLKDSLVTITAIPNLGFKLDSWSGDFEVYGKSSSFTFNITRNMSSTVNFVEIPCVDIINGKSSPLINLHLAPPNSSNVAGATFGNTRYGGTVFHSGIDLSANVGEPVYAMFDGIVNNVIDSQPNRSNNAYPSDYNLDRNNAGNRITINSTVNGENIGIGYWHLQAGNAIAINPRTGVPYKNGEIVYQGEIIGYVGITGNANQSVPHLHLTVYKSGSVVSPNPYINGTISTSSIYITNPCNR